MKIKLTADMAKLRSEARARLDEIFAVRLDVIMSPMSVIHTRKAVYADSLLSGVVTLKSSPMLKPEAERLGISEAALAKRIKAKREAQDASIGALEADRQATQAAIDRASSPAELVTIIEGHR